jgi:hypothetical protein
MITYAGMQVEIMDVDGMTVTIRRTDGLEFESSKFIIRPITSLVDTSMGYEIEKKLKEVRNLYAVNEEKSIREKSNS